MVSKQKNRSPRVIAYVRVSTDQQDVNKQRLEILDYANRNKITIDEFIMVEGSSRKTPAERRIDEMLAKFIPGDTLVISELSRLGRSIPEVIALVNTLVKLNVRVMIIKQGMDLKGEHDTTSKVMVTVFSLLAELERDLISQRTKAALAPLKGTGALGRRKGSTGKSKFDGREEEIQTFLRKKVSVAAIARMLDCSRVGLANFINSRKLRKPIAS